MSRPKGSPPTLPNPASPIVLVGEAPGSTEIDKGEPFVGDAGGVLRDALAEAHIDEASIFITNSVACRPLNPAKPIRTPTPAAIDACQGRLAHDLKLNPGAVLVALGATAVQALTGRRDFPVTKEHGTELPSNWGTVVPTVHPASGFHRPADRATLFAMLVDDLKDARRLAGLGDDAMNVPNVPTFRLRFPTSEVMFWAARYSYTDDAEVEAIGRAAAARRADRGRSDACVR